MVVVKVSLKVECLVLEEVVKELIQEGGGAG